MTSFPYVDFTTVRVLLIDDESYTRSIIRSQLLNIGVRDITEAGNGRDGLIEALRVRPHLILCDVHMQPVNGLEFLVALRAQKIEAVRDTPVIYLTADAKSDVVLFAKEHKANGYLVKPISTAQLQAHIAAVADKIKAAK